MKKLSVLCILVCAAVLFCSCGKDERAVLGYEQPVATLVTAAEYSDTTSYLSCFTPEAAAAYKNGDSYNETLAETLLARGEDKAEFAYKLSDKKELDSKTVKDLEKSYKDSYHKNVTIKKAVAMTAKFTQTSEGEELSDSREITVVKIENNWYIFGDVIEKFDLSKKS